MPFHRERAIGCPLFEQVNLVASLLEEGLEGGDRRTLPGLRRSRQLEDKRSACLRTHDGQQGGGACEQPLSSRATAIVLLRGVHAVTLPRRVPQQADTYRAYASFSSHLACAS